MRSGSAMTSVLFPDLLQLVETYVFVVHEEVNSIVAEHDRFDDARNEVGFSILNYLCVYRFADEPGSLISTVPTKCLSDKSRQECADDPEYGRQALATPQSLAVLASALSYRL